MFSHNPAGRRSSRKNYQAADVKPKGSAAPRSTWAESSLLQDATEAKSRRGLKKGMRALDRGWGSLNV